MRGSRGVDERWTASARRVLTTHAVATAWQKLNPTLIAKSFKECGISLNTDGSEDYLLKIKDLSQATFEGWEDHDPRPEKQEYEDEEKEILEDDFDEEELVEYVVVDDDGGVSGPSMAPRVLL